MNVANFSRICTALVVVLVVIVGGVVVLTDPATLDFETYLRDVSIAVGLLAVGHGIDSKSTP